MQKTHLLAALLFFGWACSNASQETTDTASESQTTVRAAIDFQVAGDSISNASQKAFVGALMKAINERGTASAVSFCNVHALPIADSLSQHYNCTIQRISDRYRNPADKPNAEDSTVIAHYQAQKTTGAILTARLSEQENKVIYYKPIMLGMPACLKCHGNPNTDIDISTLSAIRNKYPTDLATGYKQGDLRGVWKITFRK
jgi:hypothetical protein